MCVCVFDETLFENSFFVSQKKENHLVSTKKKTQRKSGGFILLLFLFYVFSCAKTLLSLFFVCCAFFFLSSAFLHFFFPCFLSKRGVRETRRYEIANSKVRVPTILIVVGKQSAGVNRWDVKFVEVGKILAILDVRNDGCPKCSLAHRRKIKSSEPRVCVDIL